MYLLYSYILITHIHYYIYISITLTTPGTIICRPWNICFVRGSNPQHVAQKSNSLVIAIKRSLLPKPYLKNSIISSLENVIYLVMQLIDRYVPSLSNIYTWNVLTKDIQLFQALLVGTPISSIDHYKFLFNGIPVMTKYKLKTINWSTH